MAYYGKVLQDFEPKKAYEFLKKSLLTMPKEAPYRGQKYFKEGDFEYKNDYSGNLESFRGKEKILFKGIKCYEANYFGGLVDKE